MGKYDGKILLSDMDGTLLNSESRVGDENRQAIRKFIEEGGRFGIATGRMLSNALAFLDGVDVNGYCILANGSQLYDLKAQCYMKEYGIEKENMRTFLKKCVDEKTQIGVQIYAKDMCHLISRKEYVNPIVVRDHQPISFDTLEDVMDIEWVKILFSGSEADIKWLGAKSAYLEELGLISRVRSAINYYEFLPAGVSKGYMVAQLKKYVKETDTIYAVGDYYNDIEMLKQADVGIAMGNAPDEVKGHADKVCTDCDNNAIAYVIEHIIK